MTPLRIYEAPTDWFQLGWNIVAANPGYLPEIPTGLNRWERYDFRAGVISAVYKQMLPQEWVK